MFYNQQIYGEIKSFKKRESKSDHDTPAQESPSKLQSRHSSTVSLSLLSSEIGETPWEGGEILSSVLETVEKYSLLSVKKDAERSDLFRVILRLLLWGLNNGSVKTRMFAACKMRSLLENYTFGPNNENEDRVPTFLKQNHVRKLLFMVGSVHESYITAKSLEKKIPAELIELYQFMIKRWSLQLSAYQFGISSRDLDDPHEFDEYINSPSWLFSHENHFIPGMFV